MLKRDAKARFVCRETGIVFKRRFWRFCSGANRTETELDDKKHAALLDRQKETPTPLLTDVSSRKRWWIFQGEFYLEDEGYNEEEMKIVLLDRLRQKERKLQNARARLSKGDVESSAVRQSIPDEVKIFVWRRDGGRCVKCGSRDKLEFDHLIPLALNGGNTARNLQLLCENCNRSKGGNLA